MKRTPLSEFAGKHGQSKAAELLGLTQGSLNKALHSGREVYVTRRKDGGYEAFEVKPFPSSRRAA